MGIYLNVLKCWKYCWSILSGTGQLPSGIPCANLISDYDINSPWSDRLFKFMRMLVFIHAIHLMPACFISFGKRRTWEWFSWTISSIHIFNSRKAHDNIVSWDLTCDWLYLTQIAWQSHDDVIKWKHFSALLAICAGNSPVTGEFPSQRPVTRSFDVLFDLRLNKRLSKQSSGWWFETPSLPVWRHSIGNPPSQKSSLQILTDASTSI